MFLLYQLGTQFYEGSQTNTGLEQDVEIEPHDIVQPEQGTSISNLELPDEITQTSAVDEHASINNPYTFKQSIAVSLTECAAEERSNIDNKGGCIDQGNQ